MTKQAEVWERDYRARGAIWGKNTLRFPRLPEGLEILEVGCGNGKTLAAIMGQTPRQAHALDFSMQALRLCRERFKGGDNAALTSADATALPYGDCEFDAVILYFILDNLLEEGRGLAVKEALRVLKPGGIALFADFARGDFRQRTGKVKEMVEPHTPLKRNGLICHYFSEDEVRGLFRDFVLESIEARRYAPIRNRPLLLRYEFHARLRKPGYHPSVGLPPNLPSST